MKYSFLIFFSCVMCSVFQVNASIQWTDTTTPLIQGDNNNAFPEAFPLIVETGSDNTKEASADTTYFPFSEVTDSSVSKFFRYKNLPSLTGAYLKLFVNVSNSTGNNEFIYVAFREDSNANFLIGSISTTAITSTETVATNHTINFLSDVCPNVGLTTNCDSFLGVSKESKITAYIFISDSSYFLGNTITAADLANGGMYLTMNVSEKTFDSTQASLVINDIGAGDGRVRISFTGSTIDKFDKTYACYSKTAIPVAGSTAPICSDTIVELANSASATDAYIKPLDNNVDYYIGIFMATKYNLTSFMTTHTTFITPEPIEVMLKKQNCFLLTAGFGGSHPTIEFFRFIRDHYLRNFISGQIFIDAYYFFAPKAAMTIFKSAILSKFIRDFANVLSYIFHLFFYLSIFVGTIIGILYASFLIDTNRTNKIDNKNLIDTNKE